MIPLRDVIPSRTHPGVTISLIAVNVLVYLFQAMLSERTAEAFVNTFAMVPAHFSLVDVFTSMFVHAGVAHLAGNLLFLWIFGDNVEDRLGHGRFAVFYLICGFVAAFAQTALNPDSLIPMVGASGAIAGVMGAYLVLYPHSRVLMLFPFPPIVFELPAVFFLGFWFVMQFLSGISTLPVFQAGNLSGGVAFWAHVAGFACGLALVIPMRRRERMDVDWWDTRTS
ncbi:MAG: rhomboid family intramembrane serine protease [Acidobacteria bacterium]|nr:rhomboid family intramembrane serine protease [Acidobacteriota bacterium]MSO60711.1 rhomboid family intramembrane serine protease [Acidobacteriota bacterium]